MSLNLVCIDADNYQGMGIEYVERLKAGIERNMSRPYQFRAFIVTHKTTGLHGWWNKMILFAPWMFNKGDRIIYFDLDTIIKAPIDRLADYCGSFAMLRDFYREDGYGSGVMMLEAGHPDILSIWNKFTQDGWPQTDSGGDQAFIESCKVKTDRIQDLYPGMFASFKVHGNPKEASVICFHGHPKNHHLPDDHELKKIWQGEN